MLLTHTKDCRQISFAQPWGITLRGIPNPREDVHTLQERGMSEGPAIKDWDWSVSSLQANCVSSAVLDKLSVVSLFPSYIRQLPSSGQLHLHLTLRMFNFGADEPVCFQHYSTPKEAQIALQIGCCSSWFTPIQAEYPVTHQMSTFKIIWFYLRCLILSSLSQQVSVYVRTKDSI